MKEEKLKQLEEKYKELETNLISLSSMNSQKFVDETNSVDEIDLKEIWRAIWADKWLIVIISTVFAIGTALYALSVPNEYKSTVLLVPTTSSSPSSLSKFAGQFGGLASLAGVDLGSGGAEDKTVVAMELIGTWGFLESFIEDNNIEVEVFATKDWDRGSNQLIIDTNLYDQTNQKWVREFDVTKGQHAKPSSWELFISFKDRVSISQDKDSGLITLSVEYFSPEIAKHWCDKLVMAINTHIRKQDKEDAMKSIAYLKNKINETNISDMQSVFYQLIEEQTKTLMLAEVRDEYVFRTISPAKIAEAKSRPNRKILLILGVLLGNMFSILIVIIRHFRK